MNIPWEAFHYWSSIWLNQDPHTRVQPGCLAVFYFNETVISKLNNWLVSDFVCIKPPPPKKKKKKKWLTSYKIIPVAFSKQSTLHIFILISLKFIPLGPSDKSSSLILVIPEPILAKLHNVVCRNKLCHIFLPHLSCIDTVYQSLIEYNVKILWFPSQNYWKTIS